MHLIEAARKFVETVDADSKAGFFEVPTGLQIAESVSRPKAAEPIPVLFVYDEEILRRADSTELVRLRV
jgi:hypothetical protein